MNAVPLDTATERTVCVAMTDLLLLTAEMVDMPSPSFDQRSFADWVEGELRAVPWLRVDRLRDNVVARTSFGCAQRVVLAGHLDTVPINENVPSRCEGDVLWGCGTSDMKSGLAVMLELARTVDAPTVDVTYVFYEDEEVEAQHNGLAFLAREAPQLLHGDAAILGEPTDGVIEAGCQGTMRAVARFHGVRAHSARPWMGANAIQKMAPVLARLAAYEERRPVLDGCEFREAMQAVLVDGGVAGNVVPDLATLTVNHRFAPDRSPADAETHVREVLSGADEVEIVDMAPAAAPGLGHPLLAALRDRHGLTVRAKLGWTDVARFSSLGIPAINLGPGDPLLAHRADERVSREPIERTYVVLQALLTEAR
jgi:succinyl-diaminopimelate desuccinylase